jgi:glycosyltransferase involved in cell wall biosynthesis
MISMIKEVHNSNFPLPDKNILMISFTSFVQKFYQTLPAEIARQSGARVKILVPPYWKELWSNGKKYLEKSSDPGYEIVVGKTAFTGNLHFAVFRNQLMKLLKKFQPQIIDLENEVRNSMAKDVLEQKGYKGRLEIITHGVDTDAFKPRDMSTQNKDTKPVIGYVGSLVEQKGINHLLKAAHDLQCKILIVGDGREKENLSKLSRDLQIDVQFEPAASHKQVADYMNRMDIFVLPSLSRPNWVEKFGRVLIEAMACGIPVIGSSSGEIPNVLREAGLIFKEGDPDDLRNKITSLLNNKDLRIKLGKLGRERAVKNYSWRSIAGKTVNIYEQLLKN